MSSRPARSFEVSLPQYEGPLDLLVELVSREELEVETLPIARLTQQFLAYVKEADSFDLDLGTEWALMAATLIYLKSHRLLPQKSQEDIAAATETGNLVRDLIERDNLRRLGSHLGWQWAGSGQWPAPEPVVEPEPGPSQERGPVPLNALDVALLAQKALAAVQAAASLDLQPPAVRIEEMLHWLEDRLRGLSAPQRLAFDALWFELPGDPHRMAFLLAVLEAARSRSLTIEQAEIFAPIWLARAAENTGKSERAATP